MKKLLIVEDDAVAIASMKKLTSQIGKTYVATTCEAAITMTHDIYPDIILLDLGLPDCTGFEVIEALKSDEKYFHIPIIVITSSSDRGSHLRAIRSGADDFLSKPFDYKLLKSRIDALFELQDKFLPPTIDVEYKAFDSKFSNVLGMLSEAVIVTNSLDEIELVNQYGLNLLGYSQDELVGRNINVVVPFSDCKILENDDFLVKSQDIVNIPHNFNITTKLGKNLSVEINSAQYNDKKGLHFLTVVKDLTEKQAIQIKLLKSALFDPLTGLNTMTAFHIDFDKLASTEGTQGLISALMIDLDDFHDLNIIYGHKWCDNLLIDLANGIGSLSNVGSLRGYRMMGDRFLLCTCVDETQNAITKSDWLVNGVKDLISSLSQQLNIKLSITAASLSCTINDLDKKPMLQLLETSLITAKSGSERGSFIAADATHYTHRINLALISQLLLSNPNHFELSVAIQPKVYLNGNISSFEILLRKEDGDFPNITLQEFIELAESTGAIIDIGYFVIKEACLFLSQLPTNNRMHVSVNLSIRQLSDTCFADKVVEICTANNISNDLIRFELTESMISEDISLVAERLEILTAAGFSISIDDFGTGQSNLRYIHRLPMTELKIDKSFIDDIIDADGNYPLVDSICALSRAMGLTLVAEGVETYSQVQYLLGTGCQEIQGYYFYRPMTTKKCLALLIMNNSLLSNSLNTI